MNEKIQAHHLKRLAGVYVRQSGPGQIRNNPESTRRQRALKERARQLLLRDCIFANVLLADEEKVFDLNDLHDRVILGIEGVLAEYELGRLRQRMQACWWEKAKRGELFSNIATGYVEVHGPGPDKHSTLEKHPNQRVQHSLERMFQRFDQASSVRQLWQWYLEHEEPLPYVAHGDDPHHVRWLPANYKRLLWMLKNPAYTGAYVVGRMPTIVRRGEDGERIRCRRLVPADQWAVVEKSRFPAYISWERYEGNLAKIQRNATVKGEASQGAPRAGAALLAGLLRCGRCGRRLGVHYDQSGDPRYVCREGWTGHERRFSVSGRRLEPLFCEVLLEALRPAGIEAARRAAELGEQEHRCQHQRLSEELKQREYEAERARRQYDRVEPENRLVAGELEQRWNEALSQAAAARSRLEEFQKRQDPPLSEAEMGRLMSLGERLETVWDAPQADVAIKKQIVRLLVQEVIVQPGECRDTVELWIHWTGGHHTPLTVPRGARVRGGPTAEAKFVIGVLCAVCDDAGLAQALNRNGVRCGSKAWTKVSVRRFRERHGIPAFDAHQKESQGLLTGEEAARSLGVSPMSVHRLVQAGVLPAEQPACGFPFVIHHEHLPLSQVQEAVRRIQLSLPRPLPADPNQRKLI